MSIQMFETIYFDLKTPNVKSATFRWTLEKEFLSKVAGTWRPPRCLYDRILVNLTHKNILKFWTRSLFETLRRIVRGYRSSIRIYFVIGQLNIGFKMTWRWSVPDWIVRAESQLCIRNHYGSDFFCWDRIFTKPRLWVTYDHDVL